MHLAHGQRRFYRAAMKRLLAVLTLLAAVTARIGAQDAATAAADREQAEERYRSLVKSIDGLQEGLASLQKNVSALRDEVRHARDELDRFKSKNEGAATQDNIKRLAEKIEEVDKKRLADNEKIVKYIDARNAEVQKLVLERPSGAGTGTGTGTPRNPATGSAPATGAERPRSAGPPPAGPGPTEKGFEYKIKSGDRLQKIVAALRAQGFKATEKQIMDANPGVDWSKLKIDQKIFIPDSR
jgi:TolA-binding protein